MSSSTPRKQVSNAEILNALAQLQAEQDHIAASIERIEKVLWGNGDVTGIKSQVLLIVQKLHDVEDNYVTKKELYGAIVKAIIIPIAVTLIASLIGYYIH